MDKLTHFYNLDV